MIGTSFKIDLESDRCVIRDSYDLTVFVGTMREAEQWLDLQENLERLSPRKERILNAHDCPVDGCKARVPYGKLMCARHWAMVPGQLGKKVYAAWRNGAGAGTIEHEEATQAAIAYVNQQLAEASA